MVWDCIKFIKRLYILSKKFLKARIHINYSELLISHDFTVRIVLRTSGSKALPDFFLIRFSFCFHGGSMHSTEPIMWLICPWHSSSNLWNFHRDSLNYFFVILFKGIFSNPAVMAEVCASLGPKFHQLIPVLPPTTARNFIEIRRISLIFTYGCSGGMRWTGPKI